MKLNPKKKEKHFQNRVVNSLYCEEFAFLLKHLTPKRLLGPSSLQVGEAVQPELPKCVVCLAGGPFLLPFCLKLPDFHAYGRAFPLLPPHVSPTPAQ